jgi:hypothetical protein
MSKDQCREKVLAKIAQDIDDAFDRHHTNITDLSGSDGLTAVVVLVIPAPLGKRIADAIHESWERRGGEIQDYRNVEGN